MVKPSFSGVILSSRIGAGSGDRAQPRGRCLHRLRREGEQVEKNAARRRWWLAGGCWKALERKELWSIRLVAEVRLWGPEAAKVSRP